MGAYRPWGNGRTRPEGPPTAPHKPVSGVYHSSTW